MYYSTTSTWWMLLETFEENESSKTIPPQRASTWKTFNWFVAYTMYKIIQTNLRAQSEPLNLCTVYSYTVQFRMYVCCLLILMDGWRPHHLLYFSLIFSFETKSTHQKKQQQKVSLSINTHIHTSHTVRFMNSQQTHAKKKSKKFKCEWHIWIGMFVWYGVRFMFRFFSSILIVCALPSPVV